MNRSARHHWRRQYFNISGYREFKLSIFILQYAADGSLSMKYKVLSVKELVCCMELYRESRRQAWDAVEQGRNLEAYRIVWEELRSFIIVETWICLSYGVHNERYVPCKDFGGFLHRAATCDECGRPMTKIPSWEVFSIAGPGEVIPAWVSDPDREDE